MVVQMSCVCHGLEAFEHLVPSCWHSLGKYNNLARGGMGMGALREKFLPTSSFCSFMFAFKDVRYQLTVPALMPSLGHPPPPNPLLLSCLGHGVLSEQQKSS